MYQKAFAGFPWFEVTQCPQSPSGFSAQNIGEWCQCAGCVQNGTPTRLDKPAYPIEELYRSLTARVSDPNSTVYIERTTDGRAVLGAIFKSASESEVVAKYTTRSDPALIAQLVPERVVWLDEIFADLDARPNGNLKNLEAIIRQSAQYLGSDTVAFRTINKNLINKITNIYGGRAQIVWVPDRGILKTGESALVVIKL